MSITIETTVFCNICANWHEGGIIGKKPQIRKARKLAKEDGWLYCQSSFDGKMIDACPGCVERFNFSTPIQRGTQIAYIPLHAEDDIAHPDVEVGFVTSVHGNIAFCRYWSKFAPDELRTKANSEATPMDRIRPYFSKPQSQIEKLLDEIEG